MTESIARKLGNALRSPIIAFVPEGDFDPPTGHMRYPGTISLTQETYKALLRDIASSLKPTVSSTSSLLETAAAIRPE
jgi:creatinine amidohydrolase/Fe(II)-dependent formamide hydrolase-like protein